MGALNGVRRMRWLVGGEGGGRDYGAVRQRVVTVPRDYGEIHWERVPKRMEVLVFS